jgi:predicted nucleotidyltransferase component of viral defense system
VFKGGTCLKKCYIETYRFSEDLDFTVLPGGPIAEAELRPVLERMLARVADESGISFGERQVLLKCHTSGMYTEGRVYYTGPRKAPTVGSIKLDLSASEKVVRPSILRPIAHAFPDNLPGPGTARCYSFDELFAEKIRAMAERGRPRDLYDIINLFRRADLRTAPNLIRTILEEKCRNKGIPIPTYDSVASAGNRDELESEWGNMLGHQLPALPPLESFWDELPGLFAWLDGTIEVEELAAAPTNADEQVGIRWTPPPTVATWGVGVPLETVRFAASNLLCIRLGYGGSTRVVEPYSLRRSRDGNLLLYAIKSDTRESRAYRVDRIQSIEVTNRVFRPVYQVEFSAAGAIRALPITTAAPAAKSPARSRSSSRYVFECPYCHKLFYRDRYNAKLIAHKDKSGYPCSGRLGSAK